MWQVAVSQHRQNIGFNTQNIANRNRRLDAHFHTITLSYKSFCAIILAKCGK